MLATLFMPAWAQADDTLLVLPTGPTRDAQILGLVEADGQPSPVVLGQHRLLENAIGAAPIRDLKILPDGQNLVSDVDGRGVLITDALGQAQFSLDAPGARLLISSASVSAYAAPGEVARLLITDSNRSQAFVMDPRNPGAPLSWIRGFALPGARAEFVDAIALPGQRSALAINWASLGVSAIDIYETRSGSPMTPIRRIAGATHPNQPEETVLIPQVAQLRDIMGLPNRNLLITTRTMLFEMDLQGDIKWQITLGQGGANMQGEFAAATLLPSGRIALATVQPGVWTAPHVNHRVYWLSPSALERSEVEVIAQSQPLTFAPRGLEARAGHGASGSFGFMPGLQADQSGPLSDLSLSRQLRLNKDDFVPGEMIHISADLENTGTEPVILSNINIMMSLGACGAQTELSLTLVDAVTVEILAGESFAVRGNRAVDDTVVPGRWCARLHVQDGRGERAELGAPVEFEVLEGSGDSGSTIDTEDLEFWPGPDDLEDPDDDPGERPPTGRPGGDDEGCGCASPGGGRPGHLPGGLLALGALAAVRWRRRRKL